MANANLMNANAAMLKANEFDVGGEITKQFNNVMTAAEDFSVKLNEDAMSEAENLSVDAVGVDLMSDEAADFTNAEFDRIGMEIATARANGDKKLVRKLEMEGQGLIETQAQIGDLLKNHAENKLSNNYSTSADQDMLDMLITKQYSMEKDADGEYRIKFNQNVKLAPYGDDVEVLGSSIENGDIRAQPTGEVVPGRGQERDWQKEGIKISDLDKHIRVKNDGQSEVYNTKLEDIVSSAEDGKTWDQEKNETQRIISETVDTRDEMQTALFDKSFTQDNKTLAELWAEENEGKDPNKYLRSSGSLYESNEKETRAWIENKLLTAAEAKHTENYSETAGMTQSESKDYSVNKKVDKFFSDMPEGEGQEIDKSNLVMLSNSTTKIELSEDGLLYDIKTWYKGDWVIKDSYSVNKPQEELKMLFKMNLGSQTSNVN
jgi:hypothetical protein